MCTHGSCRNGYDVYSDALEVVDRNWMVHNKPGNLLPQQNCND